MEQCGNDKWPAQFLLPTTSGMKKRTSRSNLVSRLQGLAKDGTEFSGETAVYNQIEGDSYALQSSQLAAMPEFNWVEGSRVIVALNEHALDSD